MMNGTWALATIALYIMIQSYNAKRMKICPTSLPIDTHTFIMDGVCYIFNETKSLAGHGCDGRYKGVDIKNDAIENSIIDKMKFLKWTGRIAVRSHQRVQASQEKQWYKLQLYSEKDEFWRSGSRELSVPDSQPKDWTHYANPYVIVDFRNNRLEKTDPTTFQDTYRHICQYRPREHRCRSELITKTKNGSKLAKIHSTCFEFISKPRTYESAAKVCEQKQGHLAKLDTRSAMKFTRRGLAKMNFTSYNAVWIAKSNKVPTSTEGQLLCSNTWLKFVNGTDNMDSRLAYISDNNTMNAVVQKSAQLNLIDEFVKINGHYQLHNADSLHGTTQVTEASYYVIQKYSDFTVFRLQNDLKNVDYHPTAKHFKIYPIEADARENACDLYQWKGGSVLCIASHCCDPEQTTFEVKSLSDDKLPFVCQYNTLSNVSSP